MNEPNHKECPECGKQNHCYRRTCRECGNRFPIASRQPGSDSERRKPSSGNTTDDLSENIHLTFEKKLLERTEIKVSSVGGMEMVRIPAGKFIVGSPENEKGRKKVKKRYTLAENKIGFEPQGPVSINHPFWISRFQVTQGQYEQIMGENPSCFNGTEIISPKQQAPYGIDLRRPVESVSWPEAVKFCLLLTELEHEAGWLPKDYEYRLPTSKQWEFACRAGTTTRFFYGDDLKYAELGKYCQYWENSGSPFSCRTLPVGQKLPNPLGLYDMYGNVSERCWDWDVSSYPGWKIDYSELEYCCHIAFIVRGGSWCSRADYCRSASISSCSPQDNDSSVGFRPALVFVPPETERGRWRDCLRPAGAAKAGMDIPSKIDVDYSSVKDSETNSKPPRGKLVKPVPLEPVKTESEPINIQNDVTDLIRRTEALFSKYSEDQVGSFVDLFACQYNELCDRCLPNTIWVDGTVSAEDGPDQAV